MFCSQPKEYLSQKNIQFEDKDITKDGLALEELKKLGYIPPPLS